MKVWVCAVSVLLGLMVFGCSTNQTGKYVPFGNDGMILNTQNGEAWILRPLPDDGGAQAGWMKFSLPVPAEKHQ
jgi:hypothetical protein